MLAIKAAFSGFSVDDLNSAKEFYVTKLGLTLDDETMGLQLKLPNGGQIFVYEKDDHQPAAYTMLNLVVDDIDVAVDQLKAQGIELERYDNLPAPQDDDGILRGLSAHQGPDTAWFKDPAGNILSVLQMQ